MKAPIFQLRDNKGELVSLDSFLGKKVILFFYPKDDTPGCTKEVCSFRDHYKTFTDNNVVILGISKDSASSHNSFIEKFNLPFKLLIDEKGILSDVYNKVGDKSKGLVSKLTGSRRMTFLIDEEGNLIEIYKDVQVDGHIEEILKRLKIQ